MVTTYRWTLLPTLRAPVIGFVFFPSSLGKEKASFSLRSFFRQICQKGNYCASFSIV
ncbi:MAG: hypothetical protein IJT61_03795 [Bacteroidales bacterium]|nr:hypothetical protein [Bacteroidales bacterium]